MNTPKFYRAKLRKQGGMRLAGSTNKTSTSSFIAARRGLEDISLRWHNLKIEIKPYS